MRVETPQYLPELPAETPAMIAPIHLAAGALSQRLTRKCYLWMPLAFFSHQVLDWTSGRILHENTPWPFTVLTIIGTIPVVWYGRRQYAGMYIAVSPDILDGILAEVGHGPIHRWFWSARWQEPTWAFVWLLLATLVLVLILRERKA